jgi:LacI family gluconate utilization system Gnt-I transcriptional repressor
VLLGNSGGSAEQEESIVRALLGHRPAGIVIQGANHTEATRRMLQAAKIPVVEMGTLPNKPIDLAVGYQNADAARRMTEHLIAAGRRRIALVIGTPETNDRHAERLIGYKKAIAVAGLSFDPGLVVHAEFNMHDGRRALELLLNQAPDLDAVFCASDSWAAAVMFECTRRNISVPGQVAVCGFDDLPIAAEFIPSITTIRVPRYDIGETSATFILKRIAGEHCTPSIDLGFALVERESG